MSYLATELEALLKEKRMRASELARLSGIAEAQLSRVRNGRQTWVSPDDLQKLAAAFDNAPLTHARLLKAHLLDEKVGPGAPLIEVAIRTEKAGVAPAPASLPAGAKLPPKLEAAMQVIGSRVVSDNELRSIILSLGALYDKGRLAE